MTRKHWGLLSLCYTAFVVYGSIVPLQYTPSSTAAAWARFQQVPFLDLGLYSRADWIANGILFIPLTFLWCGTCSSRSRLGRCLIGLLMFCLSACGAIALEFAQLYFPPRTVSRNDIYAEIIGAAVGVLAWGSVGPYCLRLVHDLTQNLQTALRAAFILYVVLYTAFALFPYDFVVSVRELQQLLTRRPPSTLLIGIGCTERLRCGINLLLEVLAMVPFGAAVFSRPVARWQDLRGWPLFLLGAAVGAVLEGLQFFTYSGNVSALSLVTRGVGCLVGRAIAEQYHTIPRHYVPRVVQMLARLLVAPYLLMLMLGNHWTLKTPLPVAVVIEKIQGLRFVPFYAHYWSPEAVALQALVSQTVMYLPLGLLYRACLMQRPALQRWWLVGFLGLVTAALMGLGRLFFDGVTDPTNVGLGGVTAVLGYLLGGHIAWLFQQQDAPAPLHLAQQTPHVRPERARTLIPRWQRVSGLLLLPLLALAMHRYPWQALYLGLGLLSYGLVLWRYPWLWLILVPLALPLLDFGTRTGWLVVDELDLFLLTTLLVSCWRTPFARPQRGVLGLGGPLLVLLLVSVLGSAVMSVLAYTPQTGQTLLGYDGPFNGLRVFKACLWPLLFLPCLQTLYGHDPQGTVQRFALGTSLGLGGAALAIWWERAVFAGLWNMTGAYRVAGSFSSMHIGGAASDAYLAMSLPFLGVALMRAESRWLLAASGGAVVAGYAILVTFTRTTYIAATLALGVLLLGLVVNRRHIAPLRRWTFGLIACGVLALLLSSLFLYGSFMQQRWAQTVADATARWAHWSHVLALRQPRLATRFWGEGLGRYPAIHFAALPENRRPGSAHRLSEGGNSFLRLGGGTPTYLDQSITPDTQEHYWLFLEARAAHPAARLWLSVCEKHVMNAAACVVREVPVEPPGAWVRQQLPLRLDTVGHPRPPLHLTPPLVLSLMTPPPGQTIDVDNLHLIDSTGHDLLSNGDFERSGSLWYFTHDEHRVWHIDNIWVALLFEHGFLGLFTFATLVLYLCARLCLGLGRGRPYAVILAAAMLAFLVLGVTDSLLDATRPTLFIGFLFLLILLTTSPMRSVARRTTSPGRRASP